MPTAPRPQVTLFRPGPRSRHVRYLKALLALVLALVGVKMLAHGWLKVLGDHFTLYLFGAVVLILVVGIIVSLFARASERADQSRRHAA
jgi:predicted tellurium resistance membrane protein TerC